MVTRRDFIGAAAMLGAAALFGAIGGVTAKENGRWGEPEESPDDEEPQ